VGQAGGCGWEGEDLKPREGHRETHTPSLSVTQFNSGLELFSTPKEKRRGNT